MSDADEIVKEFLVESYENLDRLDRELVGLEKKPDDREILASVFRTIHTIKGTSGFLAFSKLEAVTHVGENLLARLRDGQLRLNPEITTALLAMVDAVRQMLACIEKQGNEGAGDHQTLIAELTRLLPPAPGVTGKSTARKTASPQVARSEPESKASPPVAEEGAAPPVDRAAAVAAGGPVPPPAARAQEASAPENKSGPAGQQAASDSTIRVDVSLLDQLMNLVGELVLARNQILQVTNSTEESSLIATSQRLDLITSELQEGVMKTRMQPIGNIWSKFPRTVRDVALGCGKQVRIEMEGKETELDKTIIEAIKDPLTHLVRNSVDHGIESPEARRAAGKNPEGRLFLRAFHEGGQVNIEISDDGAGLDYEKLRSKAVQKALISAEQAARMSEREITNLIWLPGFSTAEKVTNVSGRGVGMDVVKTNIEKIGGTVDVQSKPGQGSTVRMKIPLTLAIIPALIVTTGGDRYAIPQVSLLELVRLEGEQARKGIEVVNGAPVHRLRGRLLPLVYLNQELKAGIPAQPQEGAPAKQTAAAGDLDFSTVRDKHRQWIDTLQQVLDGKRTLTVQQAGSHESCALGKWIYATGLKEYGAIDDMHVLEKTHKEFHQCVHNVLLHKSKGEESLARQELDAVARTSHHIMELTTSVERKVLESQNANIVVLRADDQQFGLVVDEINDTEEIVVKPLSKQLKSVNTYAGATIMGDGKVALILDVLGLAQRASVVGEVRERAVAERGEGQTAVAARQDGCRTVLLFQNGERERMAIELSQVARLEEFAHEAIEVAGDREVVQYRGQIMPLLRVSEVLETGRQKTAGSEPGPVQVVVYSENGRSVGLVIDRILDIVEEAFAVQPDTGRAGVLGSAVIQQRTTGVLDVRGLLAAAETRPQTLAAHA